jgi:hypothetical protein
MDDLDFLLKKNTWRTGPIYLMIEVQVGAAGWPVVP